MQRLNPFRIVVAYAVASALWIFFSDRAVKLLFSSSTETMTVVSTFKGWLYVVVISIMLYMMIKKYKEEIFKLHKNDLEREERFRVIFDSISNCIFIHDPEDGCILDVNARTCATFGYNREEFLKLDVGSISSGIPPYTQEQAQSRIRDTVQGQLLTFEWQCKARDGRIFWVEVSTSKAMLGAFERVLVSLQDITERKRMQEVMVQAEKMMSVGGLAAGMAHEINNPLAAILQSTQVMITRLSPDVEANRVVAEECGCNLENVQAYMKRRGILVFLEGIREAGIRSARIVSNMLEFSRKGEPKHSAVDINSLLDKILLRA